MSNRGKTFKSPELALKELERFIRNPSYLYSGKPFKVFHRMRPRELLANWLLCVVINSTGDRKVVFASDPSEDVDGIIIDTTTGKWWETEHVMTPPPYVAQETCTHALILKAINQKRDKGGSAYASGKNLIVFIGSGGGQWFPRKVAKELPQPLFFAAVWVVGLVKVEEGAYTYGVSCLTAGGGDVAVFLVTITRDFDTWSVNHVPQDQ